MKIRWFLTKLHKSWNTVLLNILFSDQSSRADVEGPWSRQTLDSSAEQVTRATSVAGTTGELKI